MPRAGTVCCRPGCPHPSVYRGRCKVHAAELDKYQKRHTPTKVAERYERRDRARFLKRWKETYGNLCAGYKRPPHESKDLTVEHRIPVADSPARRGDSSNWIALCRSCNSRHGGETAGQYRRR